MFCFALPDDHGYRLGDWYDLLLIEHDPPANKAFSAIEGQGSAFPCQG